MKFIKKLWEQIKSLYLKLNPEAKHAVFIAIEVTARLNNFIQSGTADILTAIIPGTVDDKTKDKLRVILPEILKGLRLADSYLDDPGQIIEEGIKELKKLDGDAKSGFLHIIAAMIARRLAEIKWSDTVAVVEYKYNGNA